MKSQIRRDMDGLGSIGEISDAVNGALDKGVDQDTDIADQVMPVRSHTPDPKNPDKVTDVSSGAP